MQRTVIPTNFDEQNGFETISAFKSCMKWHGEVEFVWNGVSYSITHYNGKISICEAYKQETEVFCDTANEVLEYMVGEDRLRDVITQVLVSFRSV